MAVGEVFVDGRWQYFHPNGVWSHSFDITPIGRMLQKPIGEDDSEEYYPEE